MDPVLANANAKIESALAHLQRELASIRAGRANPSLIEEIPIFVYGTKMKLLEVGTISAPQPSLLTVQVWDASIIKDVQKAIMEANLSLTPSVDGQIIRLPIPSLTEERRGEYVKAVMQKGEQAKIEIRQIRGDQRQDWMKLKESGEIGEDEFFRREKILQELIDKSTLKIDEEVSIKMEELKQI